MIAPKTKEDAIQHLQQECYQVELDQKYMVGLLQPQDAWGVARCFFTVYGASYPFEAYYLPERLLEENRRQNVISVVARTEKGDIIGYGALYRSSAYHSRVYEVGQYIVIPPYRHTRAAYKIQKHIIDKVIPQVDIDAFFGEAVCHQIVTQKFGAVSGARETALEIGLMPWKSYKPRDFPHERISTLLQFKIFRDKEYDVNFPGEYVQPLEYICSGLDLSRNFRLSQDTVPAGLATEISRQFFDFAQVARCNVKTSGEDFSQVLESVRQQTEERDFQVIQFFLNLGEPWVGKAVTLLRQQGFFLGGFLPRWFDTDGLLMQKVIKLPNLQAIRLFSERAHTILDFIRHDLEGNQACHRPPANPARL